MSGQAASEPLKGGLLVPALVYLICGLAFVADIVTDQVVAMGVLYIPLVATSVYYRDRRAVWVLASIATTLAVIGFFLPVISESLPEAVVNRALSIVAIWAIAVLIDQERGVRDRLAAAMRLAESAEQARRRLLGNLSHELKTPLNAILGATELMLADCRADQRGYLSHIESGGRRLLGTFDNLIDMTRMDEWVAHVTRLELMPVLARAIENASPAAAAQQVTVLPPVNDPGNARAAIWADGWAVSRILDNLLSNAVKFAAPGGRVTIEIGSRAAEHGDVELGDPRTGRRVVISIRDNGRGMDQEVITRLGEAFFQADAGAQRQFEGMGTGLALSLRLVAASGGSLKFESQSGTGTTVRLELPAAPGAA